MSGLDMALRYAIDQFELNIAQQLPESGITVVLGRSGSGKSTLLRLLAGLSTPDSGDVRCNGVVWFDANSGINLPPQQRPAGMVFQQAGLFPHMSVLANVGYGLPRRQRQKEAKHWLQRVGLAELATRFPDQLSGGQQQRVALARVLATRPQWLLLDEPFSALDGDARRELRAVVRELADECGVAVLLVSHDIEEVWELADHVMVMERGGVQQFGTPETLLHKPTNRVVAEHFGWLNFLPAQHVAGIAEKDAWLSIRPEHIRIGVTRHQLSAWVTRIEDRGALRRVYLRLQDDTLLVADQPWDKPLPAPGSRVGVSLPRQHLRELPGLASTVFPAAASIARQRRTAEAG